VKEVTANQSRTYNGSRPDEDRINSRKTNQPSTNKVEQLKKRIERLSRQAKKSMMQDKQNTNLDLSRSISAERGT